MKNLVGRIADELKCDFSNKVVRYLFLSGLGFAISAATALAHPAVERRIVNLQPKIDRRLARKIATAVFMTSIKYKLKPRLLTSIIMQESAFKVDAMNCTKTACHDFGLTQVNIRTANAYGFSVKRLLTDPVYAIDCMGIILKDMRRMYGKNDRLWWTRYNAVTFEKRIVYYMKVNRYLAGVK